MKNTQAVNMALGQLITNEVLDPRLLNAMARLPREQFVPDALRGVAYIDNDINLGNGRFLMAPMTLARLISLAGVTEGSRVLVMGALTGYAAAVAAALAGQVVATETDPEMVETMRRNMSLLKIKHVDIQQVPNLADGYALSAPYNAIILCGGVREVPEGLANQLAVDGKLVGVRLITVRADASCGTGRGFVMQREHSHHTIREYFDTSAALLTGF